MIYQEAFPPVPAALAGSCIEGTGNYEYLTQNELNAAGDRIVVSSSSYPNNAGDGRVQIYQYSNSTDTWSQLGTDILGDDKERVGWSVDINSTGDRVVVGAPGKDSWSGAARVYAYSGGSWSQLGTDILGDDDTKYQTGISVTINNSGSSIAVGSRSQNEQGLVRVYDYSDGDWVLRGISFGGNEAGDYFGASPGAIDMDSSGNILAVASRLGTWDSNQQAGYARVYRWNGTSWIQLGEDFHGDYNYDRLGSIKINDNGRWVAIGAHGASPGDVDTRGLVKIFHRNGSGTWVQVGSSIEGITSNEQLGLENTFDINAAGDRVAVGAPINGSNGWNSGYISLYRYDGTDWNLQWSTLFGAAGDRVGQAVSINSAGDRVAAASPMTDENGTNSGKICIYMPPVYTRYQEVNNSLTTGYNHGGVIAVNDWGAASANIRMAISSSTGTTYPYDGVIEVFDYDGASWSKIGATVSTITNLHDPSIALAGAAGEYLVVGNDIDHEAIVYQYASSTDTWVQKGATLEPTGTLIADNSSKGEYGQVVKMSYDNYRVFVSGENVASDTSQYAGAVYAYVWNGSAWQQLGSTLNGNQNSHFGWAMDIDKYGNNLIVGAYGHSVGSGVGSIQNTGQVKVYEWSGTASNWVQRGSSFTGANEDDMMGRAVGMDDSGDVIAFCIPAIDSSTLNGYGEVKVYEWSNTASDWVQRGSTIQGQENLKLLGYTNVKLDATGNLLTITNHIQLANDGWVYIYRWNSAATDWELIHTATDTRDRAGFASGLEVVPTGGDVVIGAEGAFKQPGDNIKILSIK